MSIVVAALYKFVSLSDFKERQGPLKNFCQRQGIKGTLLLAEEGINGTIAGTRQGIDAVLEYLRSDPCFKDLQHKESYAESMPFHRLKVRLKKEIVALKVEGINPNKKVGTYIKPKDWNTLISDPNIILVDTRNDYEVEVGTFLGAQNPKTKVFSEFPNYVEDVLMSQRERKVAMFCTGGIRCEKASAYLLEKGFKEVYHLEGGILKYLEEVPQEESLWQGECFVFDNRVAVKEGVEAGSYDLCFGCKNPIAAEDKLSPHYKMGVYCPKCYDTQSPKTRARAEERQKQIELARRRHHLHLGG